MHTYIGPYIEVEVEGAHFDVLDILAVEVFYAPLEDEQRNDRIKTYIPVQRREYTFHVADVGTRYFHRDIVDISTTDFKRHYEKELLVLGEYVKAIHVRWGVVSYR